MDKNGNVSMQQLTTDISIRGKRSLQNFRLVWLDVNIDESKDVFRYFLSRLRQIVNNIEIFTDVDQCINFLRDNKTAYIFIIVSDRFSQKIVPEIHDMSQIQTIFVFCQNKDYHEQWTKIRGVFIKVEVLYESIKQAVQQCDQDVISMSFVSATTSSTSTQNLNQLDQTFMYTQLFKEILLETDYDDVQAVKELTAYCRNEYANKQSELEKIAEFERDYHNHTPIWWYTYESFLYRMLNQALCNLEVETILKMSFFIQCLHRQIEKLYFEQSNERQWQPITVYRGQGMTQTAFETLMYTKGGLLSFHNFLSPSKNPQVSERFARRALLNPDMMGIFFTIMIDPIVSTTPFALLTNVSRYGSEQEILFSMHTVFRIGNIEQINGNNRLWHVKLVLTADNDTQLSALTASLREKTDNLIGWDRLGNLLLQLGETVRCEQIYRNLLNQPSDDKFRAFVYQILGSEKLTSNSYQDALAFFLKALEIYQKIFPSIHPTLATIYSNMGIIYFEMIEYSKALHFLEKSLEMNKTIFSSHHPNLVSDYTYMANAYYNLGEYVKGIFFHEKVIEINEKTLSETHQDLANNYIDIAMIYSEQGEFQKARLFAEKPLPMYEKLYSEYNDEWAIAYEKLGKLSSNINDYSKSFWFYGKAFQVYQKNYSATHSIFAVYYLSIGDIYKKMGELSKALLAYEKALEINKVNLPLNDPLIAIDYNRIGNLYEHFGEYTRALSFYEKALEIQRKTLPLDLNNFTFTQRNFAAVYLELREYFKALESYEKIIEIEQKILSSTNSV